MKHDRAQPRKFTFDEHFDDGASAPRAQTSQKAKKFYTPEEVEAARNEGYERGRGSLEAVAAQAQGLALGQIAEGAMAALGALDTMAAEARALALQTALAAARRIAGAALDRYPLDVIEETVAQCLAQAAQEPRIVVRVGERVAEALKARLITLSEDVGYAGRIVVSVEPRIAAADCRLEWSDGGVERDAAAIAERIEAALQRFVDADLRRATETIGA